ncbi:hypothetical protein GLOIN_2v1849105 [Rhizophagus irregularis DAOM 181602=DAOM 197198]|nr:hypothetical protein GLOIN_2v1849105 [Rhizophagus irregularis DAOM 181602=DAOM 197198]
MTSRRSVSSNKKSQLRYKALKASRKTEIARLKEQTESLQRKLDKMKERNESLFEKNVHYLTSGWKLQDQIEEMEEKVNALEQEQDNFKDTISELRSFNRNLGRLLLSLKGILSYF